MAETEIQWTATPHPDGRLLKGFTFNPWIGCERVSPECLHCYAARGSLRLAAQQRLTLWDEGSSRYFTGDDYWKKPLAWNRLAEREGVQLKVFCASYSDVFERRPELVERRRRLQDLIRRTPWLIWLLLSKRPENMVELADPTWPRGEPWPSNVWAGTTVGVRASRWRIAALRGVRARVRFVSFEPVLEDLEDLEIRGVDWAIIGGESGPNARPFELDWGRSIERQCRMADVAVFWKQLGACASDPVNGLAGHSLKVPANAAVLVSRRLRDSHGGDPSEWGPGSWPRQFPTVGGPS